MDCKMTKCRGKNSNWGWEYGLFLAKDGNQYLLKDNDLTKVNGDTIGICCKLIDRSHDEIYEGDIVFDFSEKKVGVIRYGEYGEAEYGWHIEYWESGAFGKKARNFICFADSIVAENIFVLGNIYDNPDLLENITKWGRQGCKL